jgi:hypothetical protein
MAGKIEGSGSFSGPSVEPTGPDARMLEEAFARGEREADPEEVAETDARLEELFDKVAESQTAPAIAVIAAAPTRLPAVTLCTGFALALTGDRVSVLVAGTELEAELGAGVSRELVTQSIRQRDRVLLEQGATEARPRVVGVVQTTIPEELTLKARKIHIEGEHEVLFRSGRGAMRIRQDGDVEIVGSRISAMSRGLFRLVGRVLRLN